MRQIVGRNPGVRLLRRQSTAPVKKKKKKKVKKKDEDVVVAKKKPVYAMEDLPKPYFFLEVNSDGSSTPAYYNMDLYPRANFHIEKDDMYRDPIFQKPKEERIITSADDEAAQRMRDKYKL